MLLPIIHQKVSHLYKFLGVTFSVACIKKMFNLVQSFYIQDFNHLYAINLVLNGFDCLYDKKIGPTFCSIR
jgi:hypothetical protein